MVFVRRPNTLTFHRAPYKFGDYGGVGMGTLEARPHRLVHIWTNVIKTSTNKDSASNPFYSHHANVDRLWETWKTLLGKYRKDISNPDYFNTEFTFSDEDGEQVSVSVKQTLDLDLLWYKYTNSLADWVENGAVSKAASP
ncbi:aureusidin synthase-like [Physcomitrium patens]|uniref:aureusidin synthase-like n=1 Tax=Physcomitrium patens TaxID=3218 RepID=UPI000D164559|nr:aureusidin synthase-like [Physcomitrium patens]|eukprot:XP_024362291.1 aureusidin synthase-like [Physcomitrella patens]